MRGPSPGTKKAASAGPHQRGGGAAMWIWILNSEEEAIRTSGPNTGTALVARNSTAVGRQHPVGQRRGRSSQWAPRLPVACSIPAVALSLWSPVTPTTLLGMQLSEPHPGGYYSSKTGALMRCGNTLATHTHLQRLQSDIQGRLSMAWYHWDLTRLSLQCSRPLG